ncbi:ABC transporter permease [Cryptosporangium aurantiacum]|uniref:Peptide/nickel transport system permease protein n=1 Tax=Cryptosporangium aurantiacum TaxID=134849 RepID=A0A1M7TZ70_9ACTN|nr:ABC transporter permease [Cryptosporangium aurantiacum]SHN76019.1 peptide/nickel transport system permease protein [Cryptosporangium aurantiacum]
MSKLIGYRLLLAAPQLALVALLAFSLTYIVPGSPAAEILGSNATPELIAQVEAKLGLDRPMWERLGEWFSGAVTGDLGVSYRSALPVTDLLLERLPATLSLIGGGLVVTAVFGIGMGVLAGTRPGSLADRAVVGVTSIGNAIPEFWLGLILLLVFAVQLGWFPVVGYVPLDVDPAAWFKGIVLPSLALGLGSSALIARQTRAAMVSALGSPYIDTLTAAGVSRRRIVLRYALKNAMVPVLSALGITVNILIGASFVVEKVFSFPGIGNLMLTSVVGKDFPVVQGGVLLVACLVIVVNLLIDVGYGLLNPQARPQ